MSKGELLNVSKKENLIIAERIVEFFALCLNSNLSLCDRYYIDRLYLYQNALLTLSDACEYNCIVMLLQLINRPA